MCMTCRSWGIGTGQTYSQRRVFEQQLGKLDHSLQRSGGPYLVGQQVTLVCFYASLLSCLCSYLSPCQASPSVITMRCNFCRQADIIMFPFIERFSLAMPEHAGYDLASALNGSIGDWLATMAKRPSSLMACADPALMKAAFRCCTAMPNNNKNHCHDICVHICLFHSQCSKHGMYL